MPIQKWSEKIWVGQLSDEPGLTDDLDQLLEECQRLRQMPDLVLDLSHLSHVNSSHLSQMLRLRKQAIQSDARLRLASPPNSVWAVFLATGLDKIFDFATDVSTALAELQIS